MTAVVNTISALFFGLLLLVGIALTAAIGQVNAVYALIFGVAWLFFDVVLASSIRLALQWEKAVVFRLGKYHTVTLRRG